MITPSVLAKKDVIALLETANVEEVARRSGIARNTLYRLRRGHDVTAETLERLSEFYLQHKKNPGE